MAKKRNPDVTASQKAIRLYAKLLFSGKKLYLSDLARELGCSKPTISRLMQAIELSGAAQIESDLEKRRRWYQLRYLPSTPHIGLTSKEVEKLALCRDLITHLLPSDIEQVITEGIEKISTLMQQPEKRSEVISRKAVHSPWGKIDYTPFQACIETMNQAIPTQTVCNIDYRELEHRIDKKGIQHYCFVPARLATEDDTLNMEGWLVSDAPTPEIIHPITLAVHRISLCIPTNKRLENCPPFPQHNGAFGLVGYEAFPVRVQFSADFAPYIRERFWSEGQEIIDLDYGEIELRFMAADEGELLRWVMSFGQDAELIEPEYLREYLLEEIEEMQTYYKDDSETEDDG